MSLGKHHNFMSDESNLSLKYAPNATNNTRTLLLPTDIEYKKFKYNDFLRAKCTMAASENYVEESIRLCMKFDWIVEFSLF